MLDTFLLRESGIVREANLLGVGFFEYQKSPSLGLIDTVFGFSWSSIIIVFFFIMSTTIYLCLVRVFLKFKTTLSPWSLRSLESLFISACEVSIFVSFGFIAVFLAAVAAVSNDDFVDSAFIVVLVFILFTVALSSLCLSIFIGFGLSPASRGESLFRVLINDVQNIVLCLLRIFLCWTRYIFYDAQVEFVDIALQHSDEIFQTPLTFQHWFELFLYAFCDVFTSLLQITLSLFKLLIASYLLWLIVDLFILRPVLRLNAAWAVRKL